MADFETYLFVHVPKTAGTSFRLAVEQAFSGRVAYDYGGHTPATSEVVREHVYRKPDLEALRAHLETNRIVLFGGHVTYRKYASLFAPHQVITLLREPIARIVSEYHHARRLNGFEGSLLEFAGQPRNRGLQSSVLSGLPLHQIGFVGITERYGEALAMLERRFRRALPELVRNVNPEHVAVASSYELSDEERAQLLEWNAADVELYARALERFDAQADPHSQTAGPGSGPSLPRGVVGRYQDGTLFGWALVVGQRRPVRVRIMVDGRKRTSVVADRLRPDLRAKGLHPTGNAGFQVELGELRPGTEIRCFVEGTDYELVQSPLLVPSP